MVGDSLQNDYQAPMALGIQALWLARKQTVQPGDNGQVVNALDGILGYLGIA